MKYTRIIFPCLLVIIISILLTGCFLEEEGPSETTTSFLDTNRSLYPVYDSMNSEEKKIYSIIYEAMENYKDSEIFIGNYDSRSELDDAKEWLNKNYRQIVFEHPDFFWVDAYNFTFKEIEYGNDYRLMLMLSYTVDKVEMLNLKDRYDNRVKDIVREAESYDQLFDRVLYVYETILSGSEYNTDLIGNKDRAVDLSAYGALVSGETVCSGYTLAFTSIMQKLGIECGSEFNTYDNFSIIEGHVWNYCKLEDEYYYFDLTWDDTGFDSENFKPFMDFGHCYFAITEEELAKTNFTMQKDAPTPDCNGTKYNYFVYTGANISEYNYDRVKEAMELQKDKKFIALRFDDYSQLLSAQTELIENGGIYDILTDVDSLTYSICESNLHLYIFPDRNG